MLIIYVPFFSTEIKDYTLSNMFHTVQYALPYYVIYFPTILSNLLNFFSFKPGNTMVLVYEWSEQAVDISNST